MNLKLLGNLVFAATLTLGCTLQVQAQQANDARNNEQLVYSDPAAPLSLKLGQKHPTQPKWHLFYAHEFRPQDTNEYGNPKGFEDQNKWFKKTASIDNELCSKVDENGILHLVTIKHPDSIVNSFGNKVLYSTYSTQAVAPSDPEYWGALSTGMRYEVRARCSDELGFNHALWFMPEHTRLDKKTGSVNKGWPACGEIDLMESPRNVPNQKTWFTLHSENYYAGGKNGSVHAAVDMDDMRKWNIYWIELYPDKIVGGVNGDAYFVHNYGDNGNTDWPWDDGDWFFMMTPGFSMDPSSWMGAINSDDWNPNKAPSMDVDWVRVYTLDKMKKRDAPKNKYY